MHLFSFVYQTSFDILNPKQYATTHKSNNTSYKLISSYLKN
jgi:hypothetical protein